MADSTDADLTAGAARRDVTPDTGRAFQGYVRPDMRAEGVAIRCFARALVLDDGTRRIALVSADLLFGIDKSAVLERIRPLGFTRESVCYVGTHTHSATEAGEWTAAQVADAIVAATERLEPAVAGWGTATVEDVNRNRSLEAHLANHGVDCYPGTGSTDLDPAGPDHPRDTTLRLLRVETPDGDPIAAWSHFSVHPTAYTPHNTLYSADLVGAAVRHFRADREDPPVVGFVNGTEGDLISRYDEYNDHALANSLGRRLADGMETAWEAAGDALTERVPVAGRGTHVTYEGQEVRPGKRVGKRALFGLPFFGGGENGPSFFYGLGLEGTRRPRMLAGRVHGRKIPVAPAPWSPRVEVQVTRVGDRLLLCVPGEPTVEMGRRCCGAVADLGPEGIEDVAVVGLANEYNGYFTTPEEYDQQHYEGGHTVFGKYTSLLVERTFEALVETLERAPERGPEGSVNPDPVDPPVGEDHVGLVVGGTTGACERLEVATIEWTGGPKGRDRPVDDPFVTVERCADGDVVATDLDLGLLWTVDGKRYTARWEVPIDCPPGEYRFRVSGAGYDLTGDAFTVEPAGGLLVRGVEDRDGEAVLFAQYPPPDPDVHCRPRPTAPSGGTATLERDGESLTAAWDGDRGGWVLSDVTPGETLRVQAGGIEDEHGNHSGSATTVRVGECDPLEWPPDVGTGGGRPPGPFGIGTFPF